MPLECPRCHQPMQVVKAHPPSQEEALSIDQCESCGGLWLDRSEANCICPTVGQLDRRRIEIEALGRRGGGIASCPRCQDVPYEFRILELEIDCCLECGGVWLDEAEHRNRTLGLDGETQRPQSRGRGPYRALQQAAATDGASCVGCGAKEQVSNMYMAAEGLVCRICFNQAMTRVVDRRAEPHRDAPWLRRLLDGLVDGLLEAQER